MSTISSILKEGKFHIIIISPLQKLPARRATTRTSIAAYFEQERQLFQYSNTAHGRFQDTVNRKLACSSTLLPSCPSVDSENPAAHSTQAEQSRETQSGGKSKAAAVGKKRA
jgi:hypothetical protein